MSLLVKLAGRVPTSILKGVSRLQWKHPLIKRAFDKGANRLRNRDGVIQHGEGNGLKFNAGRANAGYILGTSEPEVQNALALLLQTGDVFYDVGANVGFLSVIAARLVGGSGRVICFEPLPDNARQIEHNARLNNFTQIQVRTEAVGIQNGKASFDVSSESTWGKFTSVGAPVRNKVGEMKVRVSKLDSLIQRKTLPTPQVIKMDVEGAEIEVLEGAADALREARPTLFIELHGTNKAVASILKNNNYHPVVLGSLETIENSPWDAYVVAVAKERPDLVEKANSLAGIRR